MPYPNSPGKHDWEALITPRASLKYFHDEPDEVPASLVLCFHDGVLDHVAESYAVSGVSSKRLPRTLDVAVVRPATGIAHPVE
jgi:hypothetical protein